MASPNGSRACQPTVHRPKVKLSDLVRAEVGHGWSFGVGFTEAVRRDSSSSGSDRRASNASSAAPTRVESGPRCRGHDAHLLQRRCQRGGLELGAHRVAGRGQDLLEGAAEDHDLRVQHVDHVGRPAAEPAGDVLQRGAGDGVAGRGGGHHPAYPGETAAVRPAGQLEQPFLAALGLPAAARPAVARQAAGVDDDVARPRRRSRPGRRAGSPPAMMPAPMPECPDR